MLSAASPLPLIYWDKQWDIKAIGTIQKLKPRNWIQDAEGVWILQNSFYNSNSKDSKEFPVYFQKTDILQFTQTDVPRNKILKKCKSQLAEITDVHNHTHS
jgi:hypothetical protein